MTAGTIDTPVIGHDLTTALDDLANHAPPRVALPTVRDHRAAAASLYAARRYDMVKRGMDIVGASLLLLAALPVMLVAAIAIVLESGRPVFYRAHRVGKHGAPVAVLKFRSMYPDAEARLERLLEQDPDARAEFEETFKLRSDPRVTRLGRILRRTSIDELPQFWNVLTGSMSLVGPRPVVEEQLALYDREEGGRAAYLAVRPGISGLWQVSGRSSTTHGERVALDRRYVTERGLLLDLVILARTPYAVVRGEGAF